MGAVKDFTLVRSAAARFVDPESEVLDVSESLSDKSDWLRITTGRTASVVVTLEPFDLVPLMKSGICVGVVQAPSATTVMVPAMDTVAPGLLSPITVKGVRTLLLRQLIRRAIEAKKPLRHMVFLLNADAYRFYERLGFVTIEDVGAYKHMEWNGERGEEANLKTD